MTEPGTSLSLPRKVGFATGIVCSYAGQLTMLLIYVMSVVMAYQAHGFSMALLIAIPALGQLIWLGVMIGAEGIFNTLAYLWAVAFAFSAVAHICVTITLYEEADETTEEVAITN